jgi:hypothetical protein
MTAAAGSTMKYESLTVTLTCRTRRSLSQPTLASHRSDSSVHFTSWRYKRKLWIGAGLRSAADPLGC